MSAEAFIDSNVILYLLSDDSAKADRAEEVVRAGGIVSVQVLNEVANVARRKLKMSWTEVEELLAVVRSLCPPRPLTLEVHEAGLRIAECHRLAIYDAMIAASALLAGCKVLFSEDMHHGLTIEGRLRVRNPFASIPRS